MGILTREIQSSSLPAERTITAGLSGPNFSEQALFGHVPTENSQGSAFSGHGEVELEVSNPCGIVLKSVSHPTCDRRYICAWATTIGMIKGRRDVVSAAFSL